jgi:hypothetical protein
MTSPQEQALADALQAALPIVDHLRATVVQQGAEIERLRQSLALAVSLLPRPGVSGGPS